MSCPPYIFCENVLLFITRSISDIDRLVSFYIDQNIKDEFRKALRSNPTQIVEYSLSFR